LLQKHAGRTWDIRLAAGLEVRVASKHFKREIVVPEEEEGTPEVEE
jgi:hypothetical protein